MDSSTKNREMWNFLGGFRSGSTLLINLLGLHPSVSAWYETKCLCEPLRWMKILSGTTTSDFESELITPRNIPGFTADAVAERMRMDLAHTAAQIAGRRHSGKADHEQYPIGADNVGYDFEDALDCLEQWRREADSQTFESLAPATGRLIRRLGALHKKMRQSLILINKTPEIPRFGTELRACLGACRIVNLVRDGREVAASAAGLQWGDESRMGELWVELIRQSRAAVSDPDDYLEVRYEDLVTSPVVTIDRVLQFFNLQELGAQLVQSYEKLTGVRISPASRTCKPTTRTPLERLPATAQQLLVELGYVAPERIFPPGKGRQRRA